MSHVRKGQHYTKRTVSAARWCNACRRATPHRVDDGRPGGPCLECIERKSQVGKGGAHGTSITAPIQDAGSKGQTASGGNAAPAGLWPMACFCRAYNFAHHHGDGMIREYYPGTGNLETQLRAAVPQAGSRKLEAGGCP